MWGGDRVRVARYDSSARSKVEEIKPMIDGQLSEEETKAAQEKTKAKLEDRSAQLGRDVAHFIYMYEDE